MTDILNTRPRMITALVVAALCLFFAGFALASALTATLSNVGVAATVSESPCDTSVSTSYGTATYDATLGEFVYPSIVYSGLAQCNGKVITVKVKDSSNAVLGTASGTIDNSGAGTITLSPEAPVNQAAGVAIVVQ
jgi:hypothetical protein